VKLTLIRRSTERGPAWRIHEGDACGRLRLEDDLSLTSSSRQAPWGVGNRAETTKRDRQ